MPVLATAGVLSLTRQRFSLENLGLLDRVEIRRGLVFLRRFPAVFLVVGRLPAMAPVVPVLVLAAAGGAVPSVDAFTDRCRFGPGLDSDDAAGIGAVALDQAGFRVMAVLR